MSLLLISDSRMCRMGKRILIVYIVEKEYLKYFKICAFKYCKMETLRV